MSINSKYPTKKLSEICVIGPKKSEVSKLDPDTLVSFVPMRDISEGEKYFVPSESKKISNVYSGYTYFNDEDVLLAKVTPCFENGKSGIAKNLENGIGFGSSEFYVFRCNPEVLPEYLYRTISSQKFLEEGANNMSGAVGLKRVTKEFIENINIPLPPLSTQSKIVAKLDEAFGNIDHQISLLKANIEDVESMKKSAMEESFQSEEYEMRKLGEITEIITGNTPPTKFPQYYDGKYLWAGPGDFGEFKTICTTNKTLSEKGVSEGKARLIKEGAVMLVAIGATIGKVGIAGIEMSTNQQINSFEVNEEFLNNEYLYYFFRKIKNFFLEKSSQTTLPILNKSQCKDIEIPLPSLPRQHEIVEHLDRVFTQTAELRSGYEAQIRDLETLRQSLLEEAFAGWLVSE